MKPKFSTVFSALVCSLLVSPPLLVGQTTSVVTTLHSFTGTDGAQPHAALARGSDGNFYGTTSGGGSGAGTIFRMTPAGALTTLYRFIGIGTDGAGPQAGLVQGTDGNFYGTTGNGNGTVFRITPAGVLTTLYLFTGNDGANPQGRLVEDRDGNFLGTTSRGGGKGDGTIFRVTPTGKLGTAHGFTATGTDGARPLAGMIKASSGYFFGTTYGGGNGGNFGTIYRTGSGGDVTTLHSFTGARTDGSNPAAGLVQGSDGNFYGTTESGGTGVYTGTVFRMTPAGAITILHNFSTLESNEHNVDGAGPAAALAQGGDGNFYGTARSGGAGGVGTLFRIMPTGVFTVLHSFTGTDGAAPEADLVQGSDGNLYGTTYEGGSGGHGTVFRVSLAAAAGTLKFVADAVDTPENAGAVTLTVFRIGGSAGGATVGYSTADGTAVAGTDYSAASGTLTWVDGDTSAKTITVPILDRGLYDGSTRTFTVTLANVTGAILGSPSTVSVNILDTLPQPVVSLVSPTDGATVGAGSALTLTADVADSAGILASVQFLIDGVPVGRVPAGGPYILTATAPGTPGAHGVQAIATDTLGRASTSNTVTIEIVALPTVTVVAAGDGTAVEGGGQKGKVLVIRTGDTTSPLAVSYKVKGSAVAGVDYKPLPGSVTIPAGASKAKIKIKPLDNPEAGTRKAKVKLLPASDGSYTVGDPSVAKIKVIDNG